MKAEIEVAGNWRRCSQQIWIKWVVGLGSRWLRRLDSRGGCGSRQDSGSNRTGHSVVIHGWIRLRVRVSGRSGVRMESGIIRRDGVRRAIHGVVRLGGIIDVRADERVAPNNQAAAKLIPSVLIRASDGSRVLPKPINMRVIKVLIFEALI